MSTSVTAHYVIGYDVADEVIALAEQADARDVSEYLETHGELLMQHQVCYLACTVHDSHPVVVLCVEEGSASVDWEESTPSAVAGVAEPDARDRLNAVLAGIGLPTRAEEPTGHIALSVG